MRVEQRHWIPTGDWASQGEPLGESADLVLAFGGRECLADSSRYEHVRALYPKARVVLASTAGEIYDTEVWDDSLTLTAVDFEHSMVRAVSVNVPTPSASYDAGRFLAMRQEARDLRHVVVISEGLHINGSELARGLRDNLPSGVAVTGGLAGDGARMERTLVGLDGPPRENQVVALGFHGDRLRIGYGSLGGWDSFGAERLITRAKDNVLYELDGESALDLYKRYLGEHAGGLPSTGLLFPLALRAPDESAGLVRTILAVDESARSITFAGDMPEGHYARLMKANFDRLVEGAMGAAQGCHANLEVAAPEVALLISCVGRKLILKQRVEEEVEGVRHVLGEGTALTGFYSYGEICPQMSSVKCELHNQTMTITTFGEA
jgi:hypothetical protein